MNSQLLSSSPCLSLLCFLLVILLKIQSSSSSNSSIDSFCRAPFKCGKIIAVYPFWGGARREPCGHPQFKLDCRGFPNNLTTMMINDVNYRVLEINQEARTLRIANLMLQSFPRSRPCPKSPYTTFNSEHFNYSGAYENVTLHYGCVENGSCIEDGVIYEDDFIPNGIKYVSRGCNANVSVPVPRPLLPEAKTNWSDWEEVLNQGIELKWKKIGGMACEDCTNSKGTCGNDPSSNETICFCPDIFHGPCPYNTPDQAPQAPPGSGRVLVGALIILSILLISGVARKLIWDENYSKKKETVERNQNRDMKAFVRNFGSILPQKFKYSDVKKMTKSFSNKLGQGGYGDVYQGKLADGRLVAVKLLKESKGNGEEFINEVASICRTSHVNIVTLLGFCYTRNKRALIYEFMSNGSLDKFIFDKESSSTNHNLEWKTRHQVAIGIARGLEYLHRGCSTRIVHFDIKPHNILLDEDFCPKISDFGLAKLCKQKESVISMIGARGTAGYIAPEVFSRTFGEVSHKSDVYSYGMMVLEMVAGRKNIDAIVSHTSEIYFPNWIYKQLEPGKDFEFDGVVTKEEKDMAKKMIIVSMWCIQTIPSDRPSIGKVLEMFEYSLESLQIPPKPSLSVPARSPKHSIPLSSFSTSTPSHKPASQEEEVCIDLSDN